MKLQLLFSIFSLSASQIFAQTNVGIGTNTPTYPLTVMAPSGKGTTQVNGMVEIGFYTSVASAYLQTWSNHSLHFGTNSPGAPQMSLSPSGNLGIGTAQPTNKIDVDGTLRLSGGNPAAGRILNATDVNGNSEWKAAPTGGTKTLFIPFTAFVGSANFMGHENINNQARRATGSLANTYRYQAPLLLPVGTLIKEITWQYFDNNIDLNMDFALARDYFGNPELVSNTSSSGALNFDWSRTVVVNHTLSNYFYWLDISSFSWSSDASLRFKGALIKYE